MRFAAIILLALRSYACAYAASIEGLCNTGVIGLCTGLNGIGSALSPVGGEQNWVLLGGTAYVPGSPPSSPWIAANSTSQWITPAPDTLAPNGLYSYQLTFMVVGSLASLSTSPISGRYASDNNLQSVQLNGQQIAGFPLNQSSDGFALWTSFTIPSTANFILGANLVTFVMQNNGSNQGLRVEWGAPGPADAGVPEPSALVMGGLGLGGLWIARRRRFAVFSERSIGEGGTNNQ